MISAIVALAGFVIPGPQARSARTLVAPGAAHAVAQWNAEEGRLAALISPRGGLVKMESEVVRTDYTTQAEYLAAAKAAYDAKKAERLLKKAPKMGEVGSKKKKKKKGGSRTSKFDKGNRSSKSE